MEENIKDSIQRIKNICNEEVCLFNKPIVEGNLNQIQRYIENLINRNKELEKENKELLEIRISASAHNQIQELRRENQSYRDYYGNPPCYDDTKYIPKSKVKEKIEEYRKKRNELANGHFFDEPDTINQDRALFIAGETLKLLLEE